MEQTTVGTTQLKAKIASLTAEKQCTHDKVIDIEYQLEMKRIDFDSQSASRDEKQWFAKANYALKKKKQLLNDLASQIKKLNEELKRAVHLEDEARREKCFISIAKRKLSSSVFDVILEEMIQQVGMR